MIPLSPSFIQGASRHFGKTKNASKRILASCSNTGQGFSFSAMTSYMSTLNAFVRDNISSKYNPQRYPRRQWYQYQYQYRTRNIPPALLNNNYQSNYRMALSFSTSDSNHARDAVSDNNSSLNDIKEDSKTTTVTKSNITGTDSDDEEETTKTLTSLWNIDGLRNEIYRRMDRAHKKIGQHTRRIENYKKPHVEMSVIESERLDIDITKAQLANVRENLKQLRRLEVLLLTMVRSKAGGREIVLPEEVATIAIALNMTDTPPTRPPRGEPKAKGPRKMQPSRKPYRKYMSIDNIEIRVGKKAEDNDELSTSPLYRDGTDWWLHATGCPGSHVIIRHDQPPDSTIQDAAALAASKSKCTGSVIKVTMSRASDIKKPANTKAGLVYVLGPVRHVVVDMIAAKKRLQRLEASVEVN
jgi:hypothetical protein